MAPTVSSAPSTVHGRRDGPVRGAFGSCKGQRLRKQAGDEPATGPQKSYLQTLAREAGEELPEELSKADASRKIDELQEETGRGN